MRGQHTHGWSLDQAHTPPHLQLGLLGEQCGVVLLQGSAVLLQESVLLLQRQDLTAEGHVLGLQVLQLIFEELLLSLQSCVLGESTRPSGAAH